VSTVEDKTGDMLHLLAKKFETEGGGFNTRNLISATFNASKGEGLLFCKCWSVALYTLCLL